MPQAQPKRRLLGVYTVLGAVAALGYLALRPVAPAHQSVVATQRNATAAASLTSTAQGSSPPLIAPAMAAEVAGRQVLFSHAEQFARRTAVTITGANVRSMPSKSGVVVKVLGIGTSVQVVATEGGWSHVLDASGESLGWVHGSILR